MPNTTIEGSWNASGIKFEPNVTKQPTANENTIVSIT